MGKLNMDPNLTGHDDIYARLAEMAETLPEPELRHFHQRLILLLINQVGDPGTVFEAIAAAAAPSAGSSRP